MHACVCARAAILRAASALLFDLRFSRLLRFPIEVIPWRKSFMIELMTTIGIAETLSLKLTEEELFPESDDEDITLMVMDS